MFNERAKAKGKLGWYNTMLCFGIHNRYASTETLTNIVSDIQFRMVNNKAIPTASTYRSDYYGADRK